MTEHAVVIAGGGPAGMMLAAELALAKVDVAVVERRPDHVLAGSRAGGLHSRTIEVLDQRGIADRFLAEGQVHQAAPFGNTMLDMSDLPTRHPYSLAIFQNQIERIMAGWIAELPVHIYYGREVTGFVQNETGVDVRLSDGESLRAQYLVGCDGGRSLIRKAAGIEFPGWDATKSNLIAEVEMTEEPPLGLLHYPAGGQGLQLGVHDAVNLGWKLAQVTGGTSPESLLDSYHAERHPVAARTLKHTMALGVLQSRDDRMEALADFVSELAEMDEPRKRLAAIITALDIHYDLGEGHPLLGRRMPDLDLTTADGPLRVFELLHEARPLLLGLGQPGDVDITPWANRVQLIDASYEGEWELPVLGVVSAPTAVLIRPDGYVAWVGDGTDPGLPDALATWFGPPTAA